MNIINNLSLAVEKIKRTVSALDVAAAMGWEVKHQRCRCPIHNGQDMNCRLYPEDRGYKCFSCGSAGDVISLVRNYYHDMSFKQCILWFNDAFHLGLDIDSPMSPDALESAKKAQRERDARLACEKWMEDMRYKNALTSFEVVRRLEIQRDENVPKTPGEPWTRPFCQAVELLPEAERMAQDAWYDCVKEKT